MDCVPELVVLKRKTLPYSKTIKRLRRFVRDNSRPEGGGETTDVDKAPPNASSAELVCRVSDETLFQLQQIYEALETKENRRATMTSLHESLAASSGNIGDSTTTPVKTPKKTPSKKRARASEDPATEMINRRPENSDEDAARAKKRRKKARRKSAAT